MPQTGKVFISRNSGIEIVAGNVAGQSAVLKFGANPNVGATKETIWDLGGKYTYMPSASVLKLSSSDVDDAGGDTGARTLRVWGLDENGLEATDTKTLTGQTEVLTDNTYSRIFRMQVLTSGSSGTNEGIIYAGTGAVASGVPTNKYAAILAGNGQTLMATYTIPSDKTAYLMRYYASSGEGKDAEIRLLVGDAGGTLVVKNQQEIFQSFIDFPYPLPLVIPASSDVEIDASSAATTVPVSAGFDLILVDNE